MLCMGNVGKYAALQAVANGKCHRPTGNVTLPEKKPSTELTRFLAYPVSEIEDAKYIGVLYLEDIYNMHVNMIC